MASQAMSERKRVVEWFEEDFKNQAKATTTTSRLEDGRVKYAFSVANSSDFEFKRFSFKVKILDKADRSEIGSSTIEAGEWEKGEKKTFKSTISIPEDVESISFIMYSESISYDCTARTGSKSGTIDIGRDDDEVIIKGKKRTITQSDMNSYKDRKNEKKLNKLRMGKSTGAIWAIVMGALLMFTYTEADTQAEAISYIASGAALLIFGIILKLVKSAKGKRIRAYEGLVNRNGNSSLYDIASGVGREVNKVADDIQQMIVEGFFPEAYVDRENMLVVMTKNGEPLQSVEGSAAEVKKNRRRAARANGKLPDSVEDLIIMTDDEDIKAKLKSLGVIQDKIEKRIAEKPEMADQVKDYKEKYYPEVVRLTDEYNEKISELDSNADSAERSATEIKLEEDSLSKQAKEIKQQLIKLIDYVIEASENLLEKLHEDEMLDITADIKSMQTTIAGKGLLDSDFDIKL